MSFPAYLDCQDSGMESLGDIPRHWSMKRLKDVASHNDDALGDDTPEDAEFLYVDISSVNTEQGIHTKEEVVFRDAPSRARRCVQNGDVIVSTVRTYLKAIARVVEPEEKLIVSTGFAVIRPREELDTNFAGNLLLSQYFIDEVISRSSGVSYPAINASDLVRISVPLPPLDEQKAISSFLDVETSKIDGLVSEQRRLIELLKEKRQAVISHAVTKGLNPNAPMKPSGIQWLGDVPQHWVVKKFKHLLQMIVDNRGRTPSFGDDGVPMLEAKQITEGTRHPSRSFTKFVPREIVDQFERDKVHEGDVLMTTVGATAGRAVLVDAEPDYFIAQNVIGMRPKPDVLSDFLFYLVISDFFYCSLFMM
ncbi:MAG: restriction endonuclease subunit S [Planctomycetota bacterium]|nr:restriction endonuclease subunit S [Planctomycetota bacterium]